VDAARSGSSSFIASETLPVLAMKIACPER
jgi:hypothetical protein